MRRALFGLGVGLLAALMAASALAAEDSKTLMATPALWFVHGPKGNAYLLGSIHVLPKNVNWQTAAIRAGIARADTFVFEVPMDKDSMAAVAASMAHNAVLPFSESLPSYFDAEMRTDYRNVIFLTHADPSAIVYMRPWLAAFVLQGAASGDNSFIAAEGVDNKVYAMALSRGVKNFRALETAAQQFPLFMGDGNMSHEVETLRVALKQILAAHDPKSAKGLLAAWSKADVKTLAAYGPDSTDMSPDAKKAMFEHRNRAWVPEIEAMLNERHIYFITVGAGHLVGKIGVPNLLRAAGYVVDGP